MSRQKRAPTQIEKYGFLDKDLTTPGHDKICMWIEDNIKDIVQRIYPPKLVEATEVLPIVNRALNTIYSSLDQYNPVALDKQIVTIKRACLTALRAYERLPVKVHSVRWEPALCNDRNFEVGFLDMVASCEYVKPTITFNIGLPGEATTIQLVEDTISSKIWFEAKTSIPSLGELFRQLSFYRNYIGDDPLVVVSSDTHYRNRIKQQGYLFMEPVLDMPIQGASLFLPPTRS